MPANLPADMVNRALDAIGCTDTIGDMGEGTDAASAAVRIYTSTLEQILRAAHWNFARKQAPMSLLADASGGTPNTPTVVIQPWIYEYEWPIDCVKARYVPWNPLAEGFVGAPPGNIAIPATPQTTVPFTTPAIPRLRPARFLVSSDNNYPLTGTTGSSDEWWNTRGTALQVRNVILTNVKCASLIYTAWIPYPNLWDALFEEAFVAALGARLAMPVLPDKKFAIQMRNQQMAVARAALDQARMQDGNEGWHSADIVPDWLSVRRGGYERRSGWGDDGPGVWSYGWDGFGVGNDSAY